MNGNDPIIFFIPCAGIYPFSRGTAVLSDAVQRAGNPALIVSCDGQLTRCPMMDMYRFPATYSKTQKYILCQSCKQYTRILHKRYGTPLISIGDFIFDSDRKMVESLLQNFKGRLIDLEYQGYKIGKQAFRDLVLLTKNGETESEDRNWNILFRDYIKTAIEGMISAQRIITKHKPASFVVFDIYGILQGVRNSCIDADIPCFRFAQTAFMGQNMGEFLFCSGSWLDFIRDITRHWSRLRSIPLPPEAIQDSWNDVYFRSHGSSAHIYSRPKEYDPQIIADRLNLNPKRKTIIAYPSSPDENNALAALEEAHGKTFDIEELFPDQIIWLQELVKFCSLRDDLQLIIRLHPRLGVDNRSGIASPILEKFREALSNLPSHCHILWPEDPISSYDLAELADIGLISWSTMGKELMRIGVPTMSCAGNFYYVNDDCMRVPKTQECYFQQLESMLNTPYCIETLAQAIRFVHAGMHLPAIDLCPSVAQVAPNSPLQESSIPRVEDRQILQIRDIFLGKTDLLSSNIDILIASTSEISSKEEMQSIRYGIEHFIEYTYCPRIVTAKPSLLFRIKRFIPQSLKPLLRLALDLFLSCKPPPPQSTPSFCPDWDQNRHLICVSGFADEAQYIAETIRDTNLRILEIDDEKTRYIHHGQVVCRTSRLIARLAHLLLPLREQ